MIAALPALQPGGPVGFIGLGNMGLPMACRLADAGYALVVYDVRAAAMEPLVARGAQVAHSPRAVADCCSVVITSLLTASSIDDVTLGQDGIAAGRKVRIVVNTSTTGRSAIEALAVALARNGISVVDSPISGGPPGARAGTLSVMVSGKPDDVAAVRGILDCWGKTTVAGDQVGSAQVLKLTNNILSAVALAATAEAFVMGAKGGLDPEVMTAAVNAGSGRNSMTLDKVPRCVLTRSFDYGGPIHTLMKDIDLAIEQGQALGVPMPVCEMARAAFMRAVDAGMQDSDVTAIVRLVERDAGFEMPRTR